MAHRLQVEELADGRVAVGLQRSGQIFAEAAGGPVAFESPFGAAQREDVRWYLEDYLIAPYAVYEERGRAVEARLPELGRSLFESLFGVGKPGHDAYVKSREGPAELVILSRSPAFLSLPWELLRDPKRATPLALDLAAIDRTLVIEGAAAPVPPGEVLRVLMVIARPSGLRDVGYQMIARPLVERLSAVRGRVDLDVLRPPTLEAMHKALGAAAAKGEPYHILHFDGHGTFGAGSTVVGPSHYDTGATARGYLAFEGEGGGDDLVAADEFALAVSQARVPLVVLNACRSGMLGEGAGGAVEAAVATRLLEGGAASVVAMGYSVYAVAAAEFMAEFYEALFAGRTVSEAVAAGRRRLYRRKERPSPKGMLPLEDWIVPVHYLRSSVSFPALKQEHGAEPLSLDAMLDRMRPSAGAVSDTPGAGEDELAPVGRFVGRDAAFYTLELALKWQRVVLVHGPAGTGKTELAKAFARWWQVTGGIERPEWVFFHSFEPGVGSFGLDGVVTQIGLQLFGPDFVGKTRDAAERQDLILKVLRERRVLLIWDNFETVRELPDVTGATPPLDEAQQERVREFLAELAREGGNAGVIITSRTPEGWLGEVRRHALGGLTSAEAAEMAEDVLRPYPTARGRRRDRPFADLLDWLDGHPLSLRLLLPQLETVSAASLLDGLKGNTANLPPGFVGEGRLASLGASLKYSFDHLTPKMRERLPALALFEGVADEDVLALFSKAENVPARFAGETKEAWSTILRRLAGIGLVTSFGFGMYGLHPALPFYLMAEWRSMAGEGFASEHGAAEDALLTAYSGFGSWLDGQIESGAADAAFTVIERQRRTMGRLLGFALSEKRYGMAQNLMQALAEFWQVRGLGAEQRAWRDRCQKALEADDGTPPDIDSEAGALWLFVVFNEANCALRLGRPDVAYATYDRVRQRLEASSAESRNRRLAIVYHQLGMVADSRGDRAATDSWNRKSLEINEALNNRSGLAGNYHQLGFVAQRRGDLAAEGWYRKALEINEELGDLPSLSMNQHQLGAVAQNRGDLAAAEGWYRKALEINEALGNRPSLAFSYHQLGTVAQDSGDLAAAEGWYQKALEINEALGNRPTLAKNYHQLGMVAQDRGDLEAAESWYRKALEIKEELGGTIATYHQLGMVAQARGDLAAAEGWYRKSLEINKDDRAGMAMTYHQLGMVAGDRGDLAAAEGWYRKALEINEAFGNRPNLAKNHYQLGMVAGIRGDLAAAESWLRKALEIEESLGNRPELASTYGQLGLLAEAREDLAAALDWTVRCIALLSEFPHLETGRRARLRQLVRLATQLGLPALEASWHRCTGLTLPRHIRSAAAPNEVT
jgi:tetratricopeptide (TPR) repeat protein